jgi:hypothetical protein
MALYDMFGEDGKKKVMPAERREAGETGAGERLLALVYSINDRLGYVKAGWTKVYSLKGSTPRGAWDNWVKAKYPTERK